MDSNSNDLAKKTGRLTGININKNEISPAQGTIMQLILQMQETFLDRTNKQDIKLEEIYTAQKHTNGSVTTLQAEVSVLKEKEEERTKKLIEKTITNKAVEVATTGVWMIPRPTWKFWTILGGIISFLGYERFISLFTFLGHILYVLGHS